MFWTFFDALGAWLIVGHLFRLLDKFEKKLDIDIAAANPAPIVQPLPPIMGPPKPPSRTMQELQFIGRCLLMTFGFLALIWEWSRPVLRMIARTCGWIIKIAFGLFIVFMAVGFICLVFHIEIHPPWN